MRPSSSTRSARKNPENIVAYHSGNAANRLAPATISQVSLRSHTGPMALMMRRRSVSERPSTGRLMPTPKSKPSSTKYMTNMNPMSRNQMSERSIAAS